MLSFEAFVVAGVLISIGLPARAVTLTSCQNGWLPFNGNCYLYGHNAVHFTEAEHFCKQHGSHLIEIESSLENAFVKDRMRDLKSHCYWLGLTDEAIEGIWVWFTSNTRTNINDWYPGEPANGGDCSVFWPAYNFKWGDYPCSMMCAPLCKVRGGYNGENVIG